MDDETPNTALYHVTVPGAPTRYLVVETTPGSGIATVIAECPTATAAGEVRHALVRDRGTGA